MNMPWTTKNTAAAPTDHHLAWVLLGIILGAVFLVLTTIPRRFFLTFFLGLVILAVTAMVRDRKRFYLVLLILTMPVLFSKTFAFTQSPVFRTSYGFTVWLSYLPMMALYVIWIFRTVAWKQSFPMSTTGLLPFAGLYAVTCISGLLAGTRYAAFDIFALTFSVLLFIYASSEIRDRRDLLVVLVSLIIIASLEGIIAILQNLTRSDLGLGFLGAKGFIKGYVGLLTLTRVMGTLGHPASLAEFFDFTFPLTFAMLFYPMSRGLKFLVATAALVQYVGLGMTFTRGGIIWSTTAMGGILLFHFIRRLGLVRGGLATLFLAMAASIILFTVPNPIAKGLLRTEYETARGRLPLMEVAFNIIKDRPFFGVGVNNYVPAAQRYDFTPEQLTTAWNSAVHNLYLFIAGEVGVPGLIFFLGILGSVLWALMPALRSPDPLILCAGLGLLGGFVAFYLHCMTDFTPWTTPRLQWFLLGLAVSVGRLAQSAAATEPSAAAAAGRS